MEANDPAAALAKLRDELNRPNVHAHIMIHSSNRPIYITAIDDVLSALNAKDDPEFDATDAAHPAWWRGHDHTAKAFCQHVNAILDGRDFVSGICSEPWESTRRRLASVAMKDAEIAELRTEANEMRKLAQLGTHRVIACGVAATHPDASLMDRGAYADEWRTQQSDEVRELRRDRDALRSRLAACEAAMNDLPRWEHDDFGAIPHQDGDYVEWKDVQQILAALAAKGEL